MSTRPKALDLFCGAGGASMGLHRAGFDVTGVDIRPQPRYPFEFHQADALTFPLEGYDFIWASPPCQAYTAALNTAPERRKLHPDLVETVRNRLTGAVVPFVIENVPGSPVRPDIVLCGTMFGLRTPCGAELRRHRWFELNWGPPLVPLCQHYSERTLAVMGGTALGGRRTITVTGTTPQQNVVRNKVRETFPVAYARVAMGIDWMRREELSQAIPPAYSLFIGEQVLSWLRASDDRHGDSSREHTPDTSVFLGQRTDCLQSTDDPVGSESFGCSPRSVCAETYGNSRQSERLQDALDLHTGE